MGKGKKKPRKKGGKKPAECRKAGATTALAEQALAEVAGGAAEDRTIVVRQSTSIAAPATGFPKK